MERDSILFGGKLKGDIFLAKDFYNFVIIQLCIYIALNEYKFLMESESKKYYWIGSLVFYPKGRLYMSQSDDKESMDKPIK